MQPWVVQLQSHVFLLLLASAVTGAAHFPDYVPGPQPGQEAGGTAPFNPRASTSNAAAAPASAPVPAIAHGLSPRQAPTPDIPSPGPDPAASAYAIADVTWCAVREEFDDCLTYTNLLSIPDLSWSCVLKESKEDCMSAIELGDASLMSLEAGLAYFAFMYHGMKAILAEEYTFHAQSYGAVAVVNKQMCDDNPNLKLEDFKSLKSCHSGYLSAAGWNYVVQALIKFPVDKRVLKDSVPSDVILLESFFSASCAPSELDISGICTGCGNGHVNSSFCSSTNNQYTGEDGAFRCLMEERGDIAFLRATTPTLYSSDGLNNQSWSIKPIDEFMYLCPSGGCKAINDNYGSCQFGTVPADVLMTRNLSPEPLKQAIIATLLEANWTESFYTGKNWQNHLLSVSTQGLVQVNQLTEQYLGTVTEVTEMVLDLDSRELLLVANIAGGPAYPLSVALGALTMGVLGAFCSFW